MQPNIAKECDRCGMRDDDWFLCHLKECPQKGPSLVTPTKERIDKILTRAPFLNLAPEHLEWLRNSIELEIESAKLDAMKTLASGLRKFAPDLSASLMCRYAEAEDALDHFVDVLRAGP